MKKFVKGLRSLGYRLVVANLSEEEKAVWGNMVASATSAQVAKNLLPEEKAWWQKEIDSESCLQCIYNGQQHCLKHD
jgi:hypothetical protein